MTPEKLKEILAQHVAWLYDSTKGMQANLSRANLSGAIADEETRFPLISIVPEKGAFVGWKKARDSTGYPVIIKLQIPAGAARCSSTGRKCRASLVKVLAMYRDGKPYKGKAFSFHNEFEYFVGKLAKPDKFDPDWKNECSHGIHFFITRQEAEDY